MALYNRQSSANNLYGSEQLQVYHLCIAKTELDQGQNFVILQFLRYSWG